MIIDIVKEILIAKFGDEVIIAEERSHLQPALVIHPNFISDVCLTLRDHPETWFDFLSSLSGIDYGVEQKKFGVVYHLSSIIKNHQIVLKVMLENDRDENNLPVFKSVSTVWKTAEWHEREAFDLLGIYFENHPDLRRILLPDDWEGYPLRKDYKTAERYHQIKIDL
ncbi:NADH-quinone oxidoreductase subunit C [Pedobacter cryophilus]|uniref:NADH-quinone oxidoreductase subunit C n=1 Tax=Pedobacter cryophilus TaxID=2571271 RepID=A0A4U1BWX5_9SPHI|nr:NADH-quinone oxidoreductase subunit C [Pedobacter cryophilus]TKB95923.1 NADH-quinone oxidoreductase subunit C [Pedobacter cryophilus]